jgi:hypothetical protein
MDADDFDDESFDTEAEQELQEDVEDVSSGISDVDDDFPDAPVDDTVDTTTLLEEMTQGFADVTPTVAQETSRRYVPAPRASSSRVPRSRASSAGKIYNSFESFSDNQMRRYIRACATRDQLRGRKLPKAMIQSLKSYLTNRLNQLLTCIKASRGKIGDSKTKVVKLKDGTKKVTHPSFIIRYEDVIRSVNDILGMNLKNTSGNCRGKKFAMKHIRSICKFILNDENLKFSGAKRYKDQHGNFVSTPKKDKDGNIIMKTLRKRNTGQEYTFEMRTYKYSQPSSADIIGRYLFELISEFTEQLMVQKALRFSGQQLVKNMDVWMTKQYACANIITGNKVNTTNVRLSSNNALETAGLLARRNDGKLAAVESLSASAKQKLRDLISTSLSNILSIAAYLSLTRFKRSLAAQSAKNKRIFEDLSDGDKQQLKAYYAMQRNMPKKLRGKHPVKDKVERQAIYQELENAYQAVNALGQRSTSNKGFKRNNVIRKIAVGKLPVRASITLSDIMSAYAILDPTITSISSKINKKSVIVNNVRTINKRGRKEFDYVSSCFDKAVQKSKKVTRKNIANPVTVDRNIASVKGLQQAVKFLNARLALSKASAQFAMNIVDGLFSAVVTKANYYRSARNKNVKGRISHAVMTEMDILLGVTSRECLQNIAIPCSDLAKLLDKVATFTAVNAPKYVRKAPKKKTLAL